MTDLGTMYRGARARIGDLVVGLDAAGSATAVPCCPGWSVRDVVAHLAGTTDDVLAGKLTGPPTDEQTAQQVARFADRSVADVFAHWDAQAPEFESLVTSFEVWPAVIDALTHEHDIRGAIDRPGNRDSDDVHRAASAALGLLAPPVPVILRFEDEERRFGPEQGDAVTLETNWFETLRWRLGRRSRSQLAALAWSRPPGDIVDHLVIFGPSPLDIVE